MLLFYWMTWMTRLCVPLPKTLHNSAACHGKSSSESGTPKERAVWSNCCFHEQLFTVCRGRQTKSCAIPVHGSHHGLIWRMSFQCMVYIHWCIWALLSYFALTDWQDVWTEMGWDVFESTLAGFKAGTTGTGIAYKMLRPARRYPTSIKGLVFNRTFSWNMFALSAAMPAMQEIPAGCPLQMDPTNLIRCLALGCCQGFIASALTARNWKASWAECLPIGQSTCTSSGVPCLHSQISRSSSTELETTRYKWTTWFRGDWAPNSFTELHKSPVALFTHEYSILFV